MPLDAKRNGEIVDAEIAFRARIWERKGLKMDIHSNGPLSTDIRDIPDKLRNFPDEYTTAQHTCKVLGLPFELADEHTYQLGCKYVPPYKETKRQCIGCKRERELRTVKEVAERLSL